MEALIDLVVNHGEVGMVAAVLILAVAKLYKDWRDLRADRDWWRAQAWRALQAGETLAGTTEADE